MQPITNRNETSVFPATSLPENGVCSTTVQISTLFDERFRRDMSEESSAVILEEKRPNMHSISSAVKEEIVLSTEGSVKPKISTLVFMDLETTGLPSDVGKENVQITEMSMVAVDRLSFETDPQFRVLNKINLCVQPRFRISPGAARVTGLCSERLESQLEFDSTVPPLLECFFRRLKKPICLLAHNGNDFDFPILQAELNRINCTLDPDIVCADTMTILREVCLLVKQGTVPEVEVKAAKEIMHAPLVVQVKNDPTSGDIVWCPQDLGSSINVIEAAPIVEETLEYGLPKISAPQNLPLAAASNLSGNTVGMKRNVPQSGCPSKKNKCSKKKMVETKRKLLLEQDHHSLQLHKIKSFALTNLYKHFFKKSPVNSHCAEVDCISLSKVCQKIRRNFLYRIDENSETFSSVKAFW